MNAWLKRCVFNLDLNRERVCLNPECYPEGYSRVWEPNALPPLVDFAIEVLPRVQRFVALGSGLDCSVI